MERRLALWIGVPFIAIAWSLIAVVALAPGLVNGRLLSLLLLALSVTGVVVMLIRVVVRDRVNTPVLDTLYPIAGILVAIVVGFHEGIGTFARSVISYATPIAPGEGLRIARGEDRQFHLNVTANGGVIEFWVDPLTPFNIVRPDVPKQIGVDPSSLVYDQRMETALGGAEYAADLVLHQARVGSMVIESVPVKVFATDRFGHNILGKPFLDSLKAWEIEDDTLTLVK